MIQFCEYEHAVHSLLTSLPLCVLALLEFKQMRLSLATSLKNTAMA